MLEHRPLHPEVRRQNPRGCASVLHRNDDAPNAANAAVGGGRGAAGAAEEEAAGPDDEAAAGAGTGKTLGAPPALGAAGAGTVAGGRAFAWEASALALGNAPPIARRASHATSSAGFGGRRSGASPSVFTARTKLAFTNSFS